MPLALNINETIEITLISDRDEAVAKDQRAWFAFPILAEKSRHELRKLVLRIIAWRESETADEAETGEIVAAVFDAVRRHLMDWHLTDREGKPIPFEPARLEECLTFQEAHELMLGLLQGNEMEADDSGNSDSPSATHTDRSADADPAPADGTILVPVAPVDESRTFISAPDAAGPDVSPAEASGAEAAPTAADPAGGS